MRSRKTSKASIYTCEKAMPARHLVTTTEKDRLSSTYLSPTRGKNYRFWEMDALGKDGVINHHRIEAYPPGKVGEQMIELKQVALPIAVYGITWRPLTGTEDQRQGLYGDELKIFNVTTERVLAVRTLFFYAITDTTVDASGETLPIPGGQKLYRFATCPNYNPGPDDSYPDLRPRLLVVTFRDDTHIAPSCDLRGLHGSMAAVASWRWRDALFEGPFGRSPGRTKFAEPSSDRAMRFTSLEHRSDMGAILFIPVWAGALSRQIDMSHGVSDRDRNHQGQDCN